MPSPDNATYERYSPFFHPVEFTFVLHQIGTRDLQEEFLQLLHVICEMDFHTLAGVASTRVVLRTVVEKPVTTMAYNGMLFIYDYKLVFDGNCDCQIVLIQKMLLVKMQNPLQCTASLSKVEAKLQTSSKPN